MWFLQVVKDDKQVVTLTMELRGQKASLQSLTDQVKVRKDITAPLQASTFVLWVYLLMQ
jgi:hypothetical protein